ncbi:hypothetical protein NE237_014357 [Protea cynaroides]|uniref:ribonuclease P n=1 Tax=Protea cynaroides TaxID=273540 RepID=A0A9Q0KC60_9MAGN|nr:hypothetical protein NE237_014357 [Protea cynaroides]
MEIMDQEKHVNKKKKRRDESQFRFKLDTCSKKKDLSGALSLYENAISQNICLNQYHFNALLYLCSNSLSDLLSSPKAFSGSSGDSVLSCGFRIFDHMLASNINPSEATITAMARLAVAKGDIDYAFELVKTMGKYNISPRLRTYDPVLFAYCSKSEAEKAYSIEEHMVSMGIHPEESELAMLLDVSVEAGREDKVYSYLQKLRSSVRFVSASTAEVIERWFGCKLASEVGMLNLDAEKVKDVIMKNGGGWHGLGWLGKGKWVVCKSKINSDGSSCCCCGEKLVCVDIDEMETEKFAESVASLAMEREVKSDFKNFQEWLEKKAQYEAIVDGANVALYKQNFTAGEFSLSQIDAVLKELYQGGEKTRSLLILHNKRFRALIENPSNKKLLEDWKAQDALYTTPNGSNDDWYWLYAAVRLKCLLVTNDEMRDHIFALLGSSFFLKWKERHQVRYTFDKSNLKLHMPPSYSVVIQESEKGSWHVPIEAQCNDEASRTWLCITRPISCEHSDQILLNLEVTESERLKDNETKSKLYTLEHVTTENSKESSPISCELSNSKTGSLTGKRKDRSPSSLP